MTSHERGAYPVSNRLPTPRLVPSPSLLAYAEGRSLDVFECRDGVWRYVNPVACPDYPQHPGRHQGSF